MAKYYAVKKGREVGVFETWPQCQKMVQGFSGAVYKAFPSRQEALAFIEDKDTFEIKGDGLIIYVDGSFNIKTKEYGYGCVIIEGQKVIQKLYGKGNQPEYVSMRNVSGEILGCMTALQYALDHGYQNVWIYYDYEGIEKWANGLWKANKPGTQKYVKTIQNFRNDLHIQFIKVLAHSGDTYNEMADALAKKAVGIKNG